MEFKIINWNIGGAKFFELPSNPDWAKPIIPINEEIAQKPLKCREQFIWRLEEAFEGLLNAHPQVVTLQEVVQYEENGNYDNRKNLIKREFFSDKGYDFHFFKMIDTITHSAQGKWNKLRKAWNGNPYFAQGNAILVRKGLNLFPVWSIPKKNISFDQYNSNKNMQNCDDLSLDENSKICLASEIVYVEQGLYMGNRDTEPRAAIITHIVAYDYYNRSNILKNLRKPLDIFIINLHLTTISNEREGIPSIDEKAIRIRIKQLDIIFNDIISRYNTWKQKDKYKLRGEKYPLNRNIETTNRYKPVWILAGDFNFMPNSYEYEYILKRKFVDLIENTLHRKATKANKLGKDPTHTLDYVFAGLLYDSISYEQVNTVFSKNTVKSDFKYKASDHFPLLITIPITLEEDN